MLVILLITDSTWGIVAVLICCELCQRAVNAFEDIGNDFAKLNWYLYPNDIRKIFLQIETNIHELPKFQCFGSISCERVVFKEVSVFHENN